MVEHGDLLRMRKQAQEGLLVKFERERKLTNTLLITGFVGPLSLGLFHRFINHDVVGFFGFIIFTVAIELLPFFIDFLNDPKSFLARNDHE